MATTLWTTTDRQRFFIIEQAEADQLPAGDFVIRTVSGRELSLTAESLTPYEVSRETANDFVAGQVRPILNEIKQKLSQGPGGAAAEQPVDPSEALFQADLMEGAARAVGRLAKAVAGQMQKEADALREKAANAPLTEEPDGKVIATNTLNFSNDAMPVISHRLNGNGRHKSDKDPSANQPPAGQ